MGKTKKATTKAAPEAAETVPEATKTPPETAKAAPEATTETADATTDTGTADAAAVAPQAEVAVGGEAALAALGKSVGFGVVDGGIATAGPGTAAWAIVSLAEGKTVKRAAWVDNRHLDPKHIRAGIRLSFEDLTAEDWQTV